MLENLASSHPNAAVILSLAVMLFSGFLLTRITKKLKLPNVTGYIFAGILIGPYVLGLVPPSVVSGMDFVTDAALLSSLSAWGNTSSFPPFVAAAGASWSSPCSRRCWRRC